jgi:hypothetical protein
MAVGCDGGRLSTTPASGSLRSEQGELTEWPAFVLGKPCELASEPINPPLPRLVQTSRIVAVLEVQMDGSTVVNS